MVVAFSWWGVNFLGIGLHSYGFTEGVLNALLGFWAFEAALVLASVVWWLARRQSTPAAAELSTRAPAVES
jgi:hypothetical protein